MIPVGRFAALLALATSIVSAPALAQQGPAPASPARPGATPVIPAQRTIPNVYTGRGLTFETVAVDVGTVRTRDPQPVSFAFTNKTDEPIEISRIRSSCGCTTTALPQKVYEPGESGVLEAKITPGRSGLRSSVVTIEYAGGSIAPSRLRMSVTHEPMVKLDPERVNIGLLAQGQQAEQILTVRSRDASAKIDSSEVLGAGVEYEVLDEAGEIVDPEYPVQFRVRVRNDADLAPGPIRGQLRITVTGDEAGVVRIPAIVQGIVQPDLGAQPQFANLRDNDADGVYEGRFRVFSRTDRSFNVEHVEIVGADSAGEIEASIDENDRRLIVLKGTPSLQVGVFRGTVRVHTDASDAPLSVMFTGLVRTPAAE